MKIKMVAELYVPDSDENLPIFLADKDKNLLLLKQELKELLERESGYAATVTGVTLEEESNDTF